MASNGWIKSSCIARYSRGDRWPGSAGHGAEELERRIGAGEAIVLINQDRVVRWESVVVVDLTNDARGEIRCKGCSSASGAVTGAERIGSSDAGLLRVREAMLLRRRSGSSYDAG